MPLSLAATQFRCTHGDFSEPAAFNYIIDPEDALASWQAQKEQLLFVGHTHRPAIFVLGRSGVPHLLEPQDFCLEPEKRYIVNVGSVGQPRDGEARASYCIFDTSDLAVYWRRTPFDLDAYKEALTAAGVAAEPSYFLRHDPRTGKPPLRELLNFSPATTPEQAVRDAVEVQTIEGLQRKVRRWRLLSCLIALAALVASAAVGDAWWQQKHRALFLSGGEMAAIQTPAGDPGDNLLAMPSSAIAAGQAVPDWNIRLGDKRRQSLQVEKDQAGDHARFSLRSESVDEIQISSRPVAVKPGVRVALCAEFQKEPSFDGNVAVVVSLTRGDPTRQELVDQFMVKEPGARPRNGWFEAKKTSDELPAGSRLVQLHIRGRFKGEVRVKDISLAVKP